MADDRGVHAIGNEEEEEEAEKEPVAPVEATGIYGIRQRVSVKRFGSHFEPCMKLGIDENVAIQAVSYRIYLTQACCASHSSKFFCGAFGRRALKVTVSYRMSVGLAPWQYVVKQVIKRFLMQRWSSSTQRAGRGCRCRNCRLSE